MKVNLRQLMIGLFLWFAAEILLGFLGLDDLADYGEYLEAERRITLLSHV